MSTLMVHGGRQIDGSTSVPGDKSISHRGLLFGAIARGRTVLRGLGPGQDVVSTRRCLQGYSVDLIEGNGQVEIEGKGIEAWTAPGEPLDCGNSGTTMRVLSGLAARREFRTVLDGDESLRQRPMDRVAVPLRAMGAGVRTREGGFPPLEIEGGSLVGTAIDTGVPSAQVKSAVILAALGADGPTTISEPAPTRDHTERMLRALGAPIETYDRRITVEPFDVPAFALEVPGDPSSAAFLVAAAILCGAVRVEDVSLNPLRIAFLETLARMGADVRWETTDHRIGERVGSVDARSSTLGSIGVEGPIVPSLIDELPLLAVLATQATGTTTVSGAEELRVKETDRIVAIATGLRAMGASIDERPDGFAVHGPVPLRGAAVDAFGDHRIAMALAVAGLAAAGETRVTGWDAADVSWPGFADVLRSMGAEVSVI